jgi:hypothetical protein
MWTEENFLLISSLCGNVLIETVGCALLISSTIKCNYKDIFVVCFREEEMRTQFKCEKVKGRRQYDLFKELRITGGIRLYIYRPTLQHING